MTADTAPQGTTPTLDLAVDVRCRGWSGELPAVRDICRRAAEAALASARTSPADVEISIVLADDDFVRNLNREWRARDAATNVLAFPCVEGRSEGVDVWLLGDVVVAFETTRREARGEGKRLDHHLAHLVVHGVLHLLGYDHDSDTDAKRMEGLEVAALDRLGIGDPYRDEVVGASHPL